MLFFSKTSQYALRALSYIVKNGCFKSCQSTVIARHESIPKQYLSKILLQLVDANIIKSVKGPGGGFILARKAKDITLYQVFNVFHDMDNDMQTCAIRLKKCSKKNPCALHESYNKLRAHVKNYFDTVNLELFAESEYKS